MTDQDVCRVQWKAAISLQMRTCVYVHRWNQPEFSCKLNYKVTQFKFPCIKAGQKIFNTTDRWCTIWWLFRTNYFALNRLWSGKLRPFRFASLSTHSRKPAAIFVLKQWFQATSAWLTSYFAHRVFSISGSGMSLAGRKGRTFKKIHSFSSFNLFPVTIPNPVAVIQPTWIFRISLLPRYANGKDNHNLKGHTLPYIN